MPMGCGQSQVRILGQVVQCEKRKRATLTNDQTWIVMMVTLEPRSQELDQIMMMCCRVCVVEHLVALDVEVVLTKSFKQNSVWQS